MAACSDPHNLGQVIGRTEVQRREVYMKKLENQLLESHPILVEMVTNCLHNTPQTRPTAEQLLETLTPVQDAMDKIQGGRSINIASVLHMKETKEKDKKIEELKVKTKLKALTLENYFNFTNQFN